MIFSGTSPDNSLVEIVELPDHRGPGGPIPPRIQEQTDPSPTAICGVRRRGD